jgi:hypothetical protein
MTADGQDGAMGPVTMTYTLGDMFAVTAQSWRTLLAIILVGEAAIFAFVILLSIVNDGMTFAQAAYWFPWRVLAWVALVWVVTFVFVSPLARFARAKFQRGLGPVNLWLQSEGLQIEAPNAQSLVYWSGFKRLVATPRRLYLFVRTRAAVIVPRRAFGNDAEFEAFAAAAEERWKAGQLR